MSAEKDWAEASRAMNIFMDQMMAAGIEGELEVILGDNKKHTMSSARLLGMVFKLAKQRDQHCKDLREAIIFKSKRKHYAWPAEGSGPRNEYDWRCEGAIECAKSLIDEVLSKRPSDYEVKDD